MSIKGVAAAGATIVLVTGVGWAPTATVAQAEYFRLEWEAGQSRSGRPTITGYIYNSGRLRATNIQLLVEQLDAAGQVVNRVTGYVSGDVLPNGRMYFEVRAPTVGATYRVTVRSFDWVIPGG